MLFSFNCEKDSINLLIKQAQRGDDNARESIIAVHQIFVKQVVAKNIRVYEDIDARDEYAVGLIALNEAVDSYKPGLLSFRAFAARVIKRRLIDYLRSQKKHRAQVLYMEDVPPTTVSEPNYNPQENVHLRMEMADFVQNLARYGIRFSDLIDETPKHKDSKHLCLKIAWLVSNDPEFKDHFAKYNTLPIKKLTERQKLNVKTIERHRKYIIAICLILLSDLDEMKTYITDVYKEGEKNGQ